MEYKKVSIIRYPKDWGIHMENQKSVKQRLQNLVFISVASVAVIICIVSVIMCSIASKKNFVTMATIATSHLKDSLENGSRTWEYDKENDIVYCNQKEINTDLFEKINEADNTVFHTIFWDDTRVLTNIKNEKGEYAVGTKADSKIYESVKNGNVYTKNGVSIFGKKYTVCYMPIYNDDGFCGMLFTGIDQSSVNLVVFSNAIGILIAGVIILIISSIVARKILLKVSDELSTKLDESYKVLDDFSENVKEISSRTDKEVNEIAIAMDNVADTATSQAAATEQAMASTEEFASSLDVVNMEINNSFDYIDTIKKCAGDSENSIDDLNRSIESNNQIVADISGDIENGVESTRKAKSIVKTIDNISFQINLLALNASVEASHAGEYGKGFAVVANEIKNLATSSAQSAQDTAEIINDIVCTMNKTQESNTKLVEANREQAEKSVCVEKSMKTLKEKIEELIKRLDHIKEQSDSQTQVKQELIDVIQALSSNSENNAAVAEEVCASTETVNNDIADLTDNLNKIEEINSNLKNIIEYFG